MSLHLILGNSGGGKTHTLYETMIREACAFPDRRFLVIVPEQFTLETQRELVEMHPGHSLMNIDILSFQRLGHRLLEEAGIDDREVLDDTGKNFLLRRIADRRRGELKVLGAHLDRMGMIDEIKSFLSELMQYNLQPEDLDRMIGEAQHTSLRWKLEDIRLLYSDFLKEIDGRAMTAEGLLTQMGLLAADSQLLADSVIALDGYTGFTPVQIGLLRALMQAARELYVTVTIEAAQKSGRQEKREISGISGTESKGPSKETTGKHTSNNTQSMNSGNLKSMIRTGSMSDLFYLSRRTIRQLTELASESGVEIADPIWCADGAKYRFRRAPQLYHLEQHLFRGQAGAQAVYELQPDEPRQVSVRSCTEPRDELIFCLQEIKRQVMAGEAGYGDFAIMTGDLSRYESFLPELFAAYEVPYFFDRTRRLDSHPFPQAICALLQILSDDFSYRSVFGFLRSGFGPLDESETDRLENYVLAAGIRGYSAWHRTWRRNPQRLDDEALSEINRLRERFMETIKLLREAFAGGRKRDHAACIREKTLALYRYLTQQGAEEKLAERAQWFREQGNPVRSREEEQIYPLVMQLMEKLTDVLGEVEVSAAEYRALLEAGMSAVTLRVAPPRKDTVVFGDMERTRLNHVQTLFLIGANDGVIPGAGSEGGILSEFERQSLKDAGEELAYSAREQAMLQNFYLYQNLTKPQRSLQITCAVCSSDGTALRRAPLIAAVEKLYAPGDAGETPMRAQKHARQTGAAGPGGSSSSENAADLRLPDDLLTEESALDFFARVTGEMAEGVQEGQGSGGSSGRMKAPSEEALWRALASCYSTAGPWRDQARHILEAACGTQTDSRLQPGTARSLYGEVLQGSVSRLEKYAACPFAHFASYGLVLNERPIASFEAADMGNLLHDAIRNYTRCVQEAAAHPQTLSDADRAAYFTKTDDPLRPFHDLSEAGIDHYAQVAMNMAIAALAADDPAEDTVGAGGMAEPADPQEAQTRFREQLSQAAFDTASDRQIAERLRRVFTQTAHVVTEQVKAGSFEPAHTEVPFRRQIDLDDGRKMRLSGRIDRVDIAQIPTTQAQTAKSQPSADGTAGWAQKGVSAADVTTAVRIVDYKSSKKTFRPEELYEGLCLQLPLYLAAATEAAGDIGHDRTQTPRKGKEGSSEQPLAAGMFYYAMIDPVLEEEPGETEEKRRVRLKKELRLSGPINEQAQALRAMEDLKEGEESLAVKMKRKANGELAAVSEVLPQSDFVMLPAFAEKKAAEAGNAIAEGDIRVLPYRKGQYTSCTYCQYRSVCGFDGKMPQFSYRSMDMKKDEALAEMRRAMEND